MSRIVPAHTAAKQRQLKLLVGSQFRVDWGIASSTETTPFDLTVLATVWQASGASQGGRHATELCEHGTRGHLHALQHCAAARTRSSMATDRAPWQSLERLVHGRAPARSARGQRNRDIALWAQERMARDWTEAYRRIVGTNGCPQPATGRPSRPRPRWSVLARSPSRTAIALSDALPAACLANAALASAIDLTSTSSASSTPPVRTCCDDSLNSPSTPAWTSADAAKRWAFGRPRAAWATPTTTPWLRASSQALSASSSTDAVGSPSPRRAWPSSGGSKAGTTRAAGTAAMVRNPHQLRERTQRQSRRHHARHRQSNPSQRPKI